MNPVDQNNSPDNQNVSADPPMPKVVVQQPVIYTAQPEIPVSANNSQETFVPVTSSSNKGKKIGIFFAAIFLALSILGFSGLSMVAYGYMPTSNVSFKSFAAKVVMAVPFMPKTVEYVLTSSMSAHQKVTRFVLDASFATTLPSGTTSVPGLGNLDVQVTGPVDYTHSETPMLDLKIKINKDFDADVISKEYKTYFRIVKIPPFLSGILTGFGLSESLQQEFVNKWMFYDSKPLNTEARANLQQQKKKSQTEQVVEDSLSALRDPEIMKSITMKQEKLNTVSTYHVHFKPTDEVLNLFYKKYTKQTAANSKYMAEYKVSDTVKDFVLDTWMDSKTYLTQKTSISFVYRPYNYGASASSFSSGAMIMPNENQDIPVSLVMKFSKHDQPALIVAPDGAVAFEELFKSVMEKASKANGGSGFGAARQYSQANNTKRRSDVNSILNSINQYMADNRGAMPPGISTVQKEISSTGASLCKYLAPNYIAQLPVDPSVGSGAPVASCTGVYATGYKVQKGGDNRITVSAPLAELNETISVTR